jgi:hypothetical protein
VSPMRRVLAADMCCALLWLIFFSRFAFCSWVSFGYPAVALGFIWSKFATLPKLRVDGPQQVCHFGGALQTFQVENASMTSHCGSRIPIILPVHASSTLADAFLLMLCFPAFFLPFLLLLRVQSQLPCSNNA